MNMGKSKNLGEAARYGKVAVLMGGRSAEREISLQTGAAIHEALRRKGVDAHPIDVDEKIIHTLIEGGFDRAFIALHGRGGEDGVIQGALETLNMPYTGSGVLGSALSMDKIRCKWIWAQHGLATPKFRELLSVADLQAARDELQFPVMVKPAREGSSYGASKAASPEDLAEAWRQARRYDERVLCEQWLTGGDYTVSIIDGAALPAIKIETKREFYNYQAKYLDDDTRYLCPCGLSEDQEKALGEAALRGFDAVGASGWGRVDLLMDEDDRFSLIDVNTVPGMTSHSLAPMAAKQAGIDFDSLALRVLATSLEAQSGLGQARRAAA